MDEGEDDRAGLVLMEHSGVREVAARVRVILLVVGVVQEGLGDGDVGGRWDVGPHIQGHDSKT